MSKTIITKRIQYSVYIDTNSSWNKNGKLALAHTFQQPDEAWKFADGYNSNPDNPGLATVIKEMI